MSFMGVFCILQSQICILWSSKISFCIFMPKSVSVRGVLYIHLEGLASLLYNSHSKSDKLLISHFNGPVTFQPWC